MKPGFPALQADSLPSEPPGKLFSDFQTFQIIKFVNNSLCYCYSLFAKSYPTVWNPTGCSKPGFSVFRCLLELAQTHVHWVNDAIQPSHPLLTPSPPAFSLSLHQSLFEWVGSSHQVARVLEFQLQHQSFQWIFRTNFLRIGWFESFMQSLLQHHS